MKTVPIRLTLERPFGKIPNCGSRFWGNPDLPEGFDYPCFVDGDGELFEYQFICQINLAEVAPFDPEGLLPHRGLLSFFAKIDRYLGRFDNDTSLGLSLGDAQDCRVLYFESAEAEAGNASGGVAESGPGIGDGTDTAESVFREVVLVDEDEAPLNPDEWGISFSAARPQGEGGVYVEDHALLPAPDHREWEDWDSPCEGWRILLQVDSCSGNDFNLNFVDFGVLVFLISEEDLAARRFDRVCVQILST